MSEIDRILGLEVAELDAEALAAEYTQRFSRPGCEWSLHPPQGLALHWLEKIGGGLFPMGVGSGKTLVAYLAPKVLGVPAKDVLVLVPAELRTQYRTECEKYRMAGFDVEPLTVASYSLLSRADALEDLGVSPKLVICDEAHNLRNKGAKRTKNFLRYLRRHPEMRVVAMSATLTTSSIFDYEHLAEWALGKANSPLPTSYSRLAAWARILDSPAGGHAALGPQPGDWGQIAKLMDDPRFRPADADELGATKVARAAYEARFASAPGVVRTVELSSDQPLTFSFMDTPFREVEEIRREVDKTWVLPDGYECADQLRAAAKLKQIALGFWYYWDWPEGEVDVEWIHIRSEYTRAVRRVVRDNRRGLDSLGDVERACAEGDFYDEELRATWMAWEGARFTRPEPPETHAKWFTEGVLGRALNEATTAMDDGRSPIIWYSHRAVANELERLLKVRGDRGRWEIARAGEGVRGDCEGLIASVASHGTGLNLQAFNWNLILCPPANGAAWEQLIGRTHRQGQTTDVHVRVYTHTRELQGAWRSAMLDAHYLRSTQGVPARILQSEEA